MKSNAKGLTANDQKVGWSISEWCAAITICRAGFYLLKRKPKRVKLGRRQIITESPEAYLQHIAGTQSEAA